MLEKFEVPSKMTALENEGPCYGCKGLVIFYCHVIHSESQNREFLPILHEIFSHILFLILSEVRRKA